MCYTIIVTNVIMKLYSSKLNLTLNVIGDKKKKLSTNQGREEETINQPGTRRGNCQPIRSEKKNLSSNQKREEEPVSQSEREGETVGQSEK